MDWEEVDRKANVFMNKAWLPFGVLFLLSCCSAGCFMGVLKLVGAI